VAKLREMQAGKEHQYIMYGDSIYPHLSHLKSAFRGDCTTRETWENNTYKSVRISIEWNYGSTANLFSYLKNIDKLKLMNTNIVSKIYTVSTLLRNCHVALYGGISSNYFNIVLRNDMLEFYLDAL
jgi:hypothetical protein